MDFDPSRAARKPSERKAIVRHVYAADEAIEADWLEWKSTFDLSQTRYRAATAKHILAFANRHPDKARRNADGLGYLLIGVEPGDLPGVPEMWDPDKIESWLSPYIGDAVAWEPAYVEIDGQYVLFITVEAPEWGDPPFSLRKEALDDAGKTLREGWVYIRRPGKSVQVTAAEHDMLIERARRRSSRLNLGIELEGGPLRAIAREAVEGDLMQRTIKTERARLLDGVPATRGLFDVGTPTESRTPEEYRAEVDAYLNQVRGRWLTVLAADVIEHERVPLKLRVVNHTEEVFESVQVEARLPLHPSWVYASGADLRHRLKPPLEPLPWGKGLYPIAPDLGAPVQTDFEIEAEDQGVLLRFAPLLVRPSTTHRLAPVLLALPPALAGQEVPLRWRATSASTPGEDTGVIRLDIAPQGESSAAGVSDGD